ncbi:hypothetical protein Moror_3201 [Moniliophthora roreri MCA 2997]|uniref:Uncharacterized protein n=1 Tax=Moniliophthora roreri (strain MCA 2997) TaxID=1381753 RepID=V2X3W3_MONRO|nr:hypothetical protein Moror_3201 [Moniliophthora roreri MCA 2997]
MGVQLRRSILLERIDLNIGIFFASSLSEETLRVLIHVIARSLVAEVAFGKRLHTLSTSSGSNLAVPIVDNVQIASRSLLDALTRRCAARSCDYNHPYLVGFILNPE